jgi:NAD(P)-dependent dehydrogenase (short-subunit alcohol dehydrogenase family)
VRGKVVLITGGGTGIGAACAQQFAQEGAHVAVLGRREDLLKEVAAKSGAIPIVADAAEPADMRLAVATLMESFGTLDSVIACAGGHGIGAATDTDDDAWDRARRANLDTAFVSARECLPILSKKGGTIVLVASIASLAAGPEVCGYTTYKHALIGLTRSLARDYGSRGVRVNAVCPGWVRTPMADEEMQVLMRRQGIGLDEAYELVTRQVPLRRPATAEEIASVCRFLASGESSIITGATIVADGGSTIVDVPTLAFEGANANG